MKFAQTSLRCDEFDTALLFVSYEQRSTTIGSQLAEHGFRGKVIALYCEDVKSDLTRKHLDQLMSQHGQRCEVVPVSYLDATQIIVKTKRIDTADSLFVDTSAFTRENLFSFLWARKYGIDKLSPLIFGYTSPREYGPWLSSDYGRAHNILGFGGSTEWTANRHLICCVGFESERALAVIEALEPSRVTLAFGSVPTRDEFLSRNRDAVTAVLGNSNFDVREINVRDPTSCLSDLEAIVRKVGEGVSIHVAPFNSKVSCLSIFALWLENQSIPI